jgi:FkbM family methyltransferase
MRWLNAIFYGQRLPEIWHCIRVCRHPAAVIGRYLQFGHSDYPFHMQLRNDLRLEMNEYHDLVTAWVVFIRNEYQVPPAAETVLDLGANIGCFSLKCAFTRPRSRVIALEPFPSSFQRLAAHIREHNLGERVRAWNVGVAGMSGSRRMPIGGGPSQSKGLLEADAVAAEGTVEVAVITFQEALARACKTFGTDMVDFVKIDIEGSEHDALLATRPSALKAIRCLGMEYHANRPKRDLFDHLGSAGLRLHSDRVIGQDMGIAHFRRV